MKSERGVTLIALIIIVVILLIIAGIAIHLAVKSINEEIKEPVNGAYEEISEQKIEDVQENNINAVITDNVQDNMEN